MWSSHLHDEISRSCSADVSFRSNTFRSNSGTPLYFLDSFRAYALSGRNIVIGGLVLILNTGFVVVTIYPWAVTTISPDCNFQLPQSHALTIGYVHTEIISRAGSLLAEAIIIALTLKKSMASLKAAWAPSKSFVEMLLLNSVLCFSIPLVLNAIVLAAYVTKTPDNATISAAVLDLVRAFRDPITSILVSRFLLELCELSSKTPANATKLGDIITSDITLYPSDVLSYLSEYQRTVQHQV
ncbi:hypothetical protein V8D89_004677 [Ganoderma adspersum]